MTISVAKHRRRKETIHFGIHINSFLSILQDVMFALDVIDRSGRLTKSITANLAYESMDMAASVRHQQWKRLADGSTYSSRRGLMETLIRKAGRPGSLIQTTHRRIDGDAFLVPAGLVDMESCFILEDVRTI